MDTKKIIVDSTLNLLKKRSIERLTIQDVLSASGVSRSTFYRHFVDKYDLMNWCYRLYVDELIHQFDGYNWEEKLEKTFLFVSTHGEYFDKLADLEGPNSFWEFLNDYTFDFYAGVYRHNTGITVLSAEAERTLEFICGGAISLLKAWFRRGRADSAAAMAKAIYTRIPVEFREYNRTADDG